MNVKDLLKRIPEKWDNDTLKAMGIQSVDIRKWRKLGLTHVLITAKDRNGKATARAIAVPWDGNVEKEATSAFRDLVISLAPKRGDGNTAVK